MDFILEMKDENGQLLATLDNVKREDKLSVVRERLARESAFPREYKFLSFEIPLTNKQEPKNTVADVCDMVGRSAQVKVRLPCSNRTDLPTNLPTSPIVPGGPEASSLDYEPVTKKGKSSDELRP